MLKYLLAIAGVLSISFTLYSNHINHTKELHQLWTSWKSQYGASYDPIEDEYRYSVFVENYNYVQEINSQGLPYFLVINKFSNLTDEEFANIYTSKNRLQSISDYDKTCPTASPTCPPVPVRHQASINWTALGAVTPVKDQEKCNSCWAFSATGTLEGLHFINNSVLVSFSEQQLIDCDIEGYNEGCVNGGFAPYAMEYASRKGIESELDYPYVGQDDSCKYDPSKAKVVNKGYSCLPQKSVEQLKSAVIGQPVSISVEAGKVWRAYGGGVLTKNCGNIVDHDVLLVGFDLINNQEAWIVKNSWGSDWGVNGYIYLSTDPSYDGGYGVCGILRCIAIPTN